MMQVQNLMSLIVLTLFLFKAIFLTGCDQTFEPFQENEQYAFSMYGFLDASADTQWIRLMPVRQTFFLKPDPLDVTMTLEHLGSEGESSMLNDSLFYYGQNAYAWNYWTTMQLQPLESYLLRAESSDGNISSVTVTLPDSFPEPYIEVDLEENAEYVQISGVKFLADVHSIHEFNQTLYDRTTVFLFSHHQDSVATNSQNDTHRVRINPSEAREYMEIYMEENPYTLLNREIFVASAGPDWHFFPDIDEEVQSLPDGISNVVNGVGYVVGIVSKTIPWEMICFEDDLDDLGHPISYPCPF
jgi:hypothetical protein